MSTYPLWLCELTGQPVTQHACLDCAEHRQAPACPFPPTMLKALANSMKGDDTLVEAKALAREKNVALLRVTSLLGCTRQAWYGQHGRPALEKPSEHWSRFRGTIFHAALESLAGEDIIAEVRLIASLEELGARAWIAGKVDHYDPTSRLLAARQVRPSGPDHGPDRLHGHGQRLHGGRPHARRRHAGCR